jgi:hypothetical protein
MMVDLAELEVDQDEAAQDAVVEDEIDAVVAVVDGDPLLAPDEGETFAQLQQEGLEMVAQHRLELRLGHPLRLGYLQELEDIGLPQKVRRLFQDLPLRCQLQALSLLAARRRNSEEAF